MFDLEWAQAAPAQEDHNVKHNCTKTEKTDRPTDIDCFVALEPPPLAINLCPKRTNSADYSLNEQQKYWIDGFVYSIQPNANFSPLPDHGVVGWGWLGAWLGTNDEWCTCYIHILIVLYTYNRATCRNAEHAFNQDPYTNTHTETSRYPLVGNKFPQIRF